MLPKEKGFPVLSEDAGTDSGSRRSVRPDNRSHEARAMARFFQAVDQAGRSGPGRRGGHAGKKQHCSRKKRREAPNLQFKEVRRHQVMLHLNHSCRELCREC